MGEERGQGARVVDQVRLRRAGVVAFAVGVAGALVFFGFFPGLPHVIDSGAVLVSLAVGALARWGVRAWWTRKWERGRGGMPWR